VKGKLEIILAIDGGGSRTRCLAIDRGGRIVGEGAGGPSNHLLVAGGIVARSLKEATEEARAGAAEVVCVSAGLAGVDFDGAGAAEMEELLRDLGFARTVVRSDMEIAHAGSLAGRPGVVALAGTGSSILAVDEGGRRVKVGGWGPVYGDEGSAYRIGQMALRAAARAYDGCGPETSLTGLIMRALQLGEFRETVQRVYVEGMEPREIAALSRIAYEAAEAGDEVARAIFTCAGDELAEGVEAAIGRLWPRGAEVAVTYQGGVLESCSYVRESFGESLKRRAPGALIRPPEFSPVVGAYLLARQSLGWPTDARVLAALGEGGGFGVSGCGGDGSPGPHAAPSAVRRTKQT
jgi:glucosamine kinase